MASGYQQQCNISVGAKSCSLAAAWRKWRRLKEIISIGWLIEMTFIGNQYHVACNRRNNERNVEKR